MSDYRPYCVDISDVDLSKEQAELARLLAEDNHDRYADGKIKDGWRCGCQHSNGDHTDPLLKPFQQLPREIQERYIRDATIAIKAMIKFGFLVSKRAI